MKTVQCPKKQIGVCGLIVGYTIVGAFMFIALEEDAKQPMTQEVINRRRSCVDYLWNSIQLSIEIIIARSFVVVVQID